MKWSLSQKCQTLDKIVHFCKSNNSKAIRSFVESKDDRRYSYILNLIISYIQDHFGEEKFVDFANFSLKRDIRLFCFFNLKEDWIAKTYSHEIFQDQKVTNDNFLGPLTLPYWSIIILILNSILDNGLKEIASSLWLRNYSNG